MEPKKFVVNGDSYEIRPLPAKQSLRLAYKLGKYIGPSIAALAKGQGLDAEVDLEKALKEFFHNCEENDFIDFVEQLLVTDKGSQLLCEDKKVTLESFSGNLAVMLQVAMEVAKYQFGSFFQDSESLGGLLQRK